MIINKIKEIKSNTAERPTFFDADVLARYRFASKYCKNRKVLDVGCGFGFGSNYISIKGAKKVIGIDYDQNAIEVAKNNFASRKLCFRNCNVEDLGNLKEQFDVIIAFEIIEHIYLNKVSSFIQSLTRLISPGGVLLLSTPNGRLTNFIFGKTYNPYHIKEYKAKELIDLLSPYFKNIKIKGLDYKNKKYKIQQRKIRRSLVYKIIYILGHYKIVREFIPFIPKSFREKITGESSLPEYIQSDFLLLDDHKNCPGLFIYAQKNK